MSSKIIQDLFQNPKIMNDTCKIHLRFLQDLERCFNISGMILGIRMNPVAILSITSILSAIAIVTIQHVAGIFFVTTGSCRIPYSG